MASRLVSLGVIDVTFNRGFRELASRKLGVDCAPASQPGLRRTLGSIARATIAERGRDGMVRPKLLRQPDCADHTDPR